MSVSKANGRISIEYLRTLRQAGQPIVSLTAYDAGFARLLEQAGVDLILVGDSLGMVVQGHESTIPVNMDHMIYHAQMVVRGTQQAFVMADMPFMSYCDPKQALHNAARLMQEGGVQAVKLEGDASQAEVVAALAAHGVPVCAHLGLRPQSIHKLGAYRVQGRDAGAAERMLSDALQLQDAGADLLLLECVPAPLAGQIRSRVSIPVIGIGAGADCDGQILVLHDVLGMSERLPRFAKDFLQSSGTVQGALASYVEAVRQRQFPDAQHLFSQ
ncbi:3-methyl-2-oxobutanoate hydroxymethyltransferase [Thiorhodospira sibirica]|uniref:3-methyl-2-oxobutanoate hydroxymethyltransferase n=1 Tax=Thiorhodospira sibirica TaxID=154347 RepID=UPI00022C170D|nr:3-methyl-2-oxobutanoate hydroxymethyltransferase [Thiorhodospira sibirica]